MCNRIERPCEVCGTTVVYVDYVPHVFLCLDCGFPDPHPAVSSNADGYAVVDQEAGDE